MLPPGESPGVGSANFARTPLGKQQQQFTESQQPAAAPGTTTGGKYGAFEATPGYRFLQDEASRAFDNESSAQGRFFIPGSKKRKARYAAGLASQEYGNYFARLQNLSSEGRGAATSVGAFGQASASSQAGDILFGAGARASSVMSRGNTRASGIQAAGGIFSDPAEDVTFGFGAGRA